MIKGPPEGVEVPEGSREQTFPASPELVFEALLAAVPATNGRILSVDKFATAVTFTMASPPHVLHETVVGVVVPTQAGALLRVTAAINVADRAGTNLLDPGVDQVIETVARQLDEATQ